MSYFGQSPSFGDFPFQILTGDGTKTYKTSFKTAGERGVLVFINGAAQRPGIDYTAAGDVIVFSENIAAGVQIFVYGMGLPKTEITNGESIANSVPLFSVQWWSNRSNIPAGYVAADGQELSRNTFSDAWQGIQAGNVPVVDEATWQAAPTERGKFTVGDGTTTFRVPDYNGKQPDSLGAVFLRGDGTLSAGQAGLIQRDALQDHTHTGRTPRDTNNAASGSNSGRWAGAPGDWESTGVNGARTATETRPLNVTGCWVIKLFGAVVNVGSADVAQLASDYANLSAALQTLDSQIDFTIIYPNGGSEASPASLAASTRYVMPNPFPGYSVIAIGEIQIDGEWTQSAPTQTGSENSGVFTGQHNDNEIVLHTMTRAIATNTVNASTAPDPGALQWASERVGGSRIKVWKIGGGVV